MKLFFNRLVAEAWAALMTTAEADPKERQAYVHRRVLHAWLLHVWPTLDAKLPTEPTPGVLALYLALGWTQSTTTHQWPGTDRWIATLAAGPPAHWLPRSQWHLSWLLHDPTAGEHRHELHTALRQGRDDPERPGLAAALEELFPEPAA